MKFILVPFLLLIAPVSPLWAKTVFTHILMVKESLTVLEKPSFDSKVIATLEKGERVRASLKQINGFYPVKVQVEGVFLKGFVDAEDIFDSYFKKRKLKRKKKRRKNFFKERLWKMGVGLNISGLLQPPRTLSNANGDVNEINTLTSITAFPLLFVEKKIGGAYGMQFFINTRYSNFSGTIKNTDNVINPNSPVKLSQKFLGGGLILKKHRKNSWLGGGLEVGQGQSVDLTIDGTPVVTTDSDIPQFFILKGVWGKQWVWGSFGVSGEISGGAAVNTTPPIIFLESRLTGFWQL